MMIDKIRNKFKEITTPILLFFDPEQEYREEVLSIHESYPPDPVHDIVESLNWLTVEASQRLNDLTLATTKAPQCLSAYAPIRAFAVIFSLGFDKRLGICF